MPRDLAQPSSGVHYDLLVELSQRAALRLSIATEDTSGRLDTAASESHDDLVRMVWLMPLTMGQRYRMADAMLRGDMRTVRLIGDEAIQAARLALPSAANPDLTTDHPTAPAARPCMAPAAGREDALHGRDPDRCVEGGGGPGESPPGEGPG